MAQTENNSKRRKICSENVKQCNFEMGELSISLLSLGDDCIHEILKKLPLNKLCATRKVCKTLKKICEDQFKRSFQSKLVCFKQTGREFCYNWPNDHSECFQNYARRVCVEGKSFANTDVNCVLKFLSSKHKEFQNIQFNKVAVEEEIDENCKEILQNVTTVALFNCEIAPTAYCYVLKYCTQLENLMIHSDIESDVAYGLDFPYKKLKENDNLSLHETDNEMGIVQRYTSLKRFQCCFGSSSDKQLLYFLRLNPQLKSLTCCIIGSEIKQKLKYVVEHGVALEELFLSFINYIDFSIVSKELSPINEREKFERIEIELKHDVTENSKMEILNKENLCALKKLTGLHCDIPNISKEFALTIANLTNLKKLHLKTTDSNPECLLALVKTSSERLPLLEEVILQIKFRPYSLEDIIARRFINEFGLLVTPFIRSAQKLTTITILETDLNDDMNEIPTWNNVWKKTKDAQILKILLQEDLFKKNSNSINLLRVNGNLVQVKSVSVMNNILNIKDPFFKFALNEI